MIEISDDELVKQVLEKDEQAFFDLYERYAGRVYGLIFRILRNEQIAEEATQDTFLKCWSRARSFITQRGAFAPWLLAIARNTAIDKLRLDKRQPALSDKKNPDDIWELLPDEESASEETRWRTLYFILLALPQENRVAIVLAYYQGMSHSEIAGILGWPVGTVKTRIRLGMDQIRQEWLKEETTRPGAKFPIAD